MTHVTVCVHNVKKISIAPAYQLSPGGSYVRNYCIETEDGGLFELALFGKESSNLSTHPVRAYGPKAK